MSSPRLDGLKIKVFADGAEMAKIRELCNNPHIKGFTSNPTLMKQASITDYEGFAREVLAFIPDRPFSFEVLADELDDMERQALKVAAWGKNVYVKIPVTNTRGEGTYALVRRLVDQGVKVNVTAIMTEAQVHQTVAAMRGGPHGYVSVFAGRVADTGVDPLPIMKRSVDLLNSVGNLELIWASPRELLNIFQADEIGCHVITVTPDILKKLALVGKDLDQFSLETVQMFFNDAQASGLSL